MSNIWGFLVQTLTVTLVAGLLIIIKELFSDKLSPRWQYWIWGILAVRILIPVSMRRYIIYPVPLLIETIKTFVERGFNSAYSSVFSLIEIKSPFIHISGLPQSPTDWIFIIYVLGAIFTLLWFAASYVRLRILLKKGYEPSSYTKDRIEYISSEYKLPSCPTVMIEGLPSAFICGFFRPVMALPADADVDDKVLIHELIHLKHRDALQSIIWCLLRVLHWCNPFMHYVFNRIGNDMETLCDQRVLELLDGEERRDYGEILLSMANDRYPRAPGTTSISNGGKNISRRITAIVRFKKYPRGMALVSICIAFVIIFPVFWGTAGAYKYEYYTPENDWETCRAMAVSRIQRCTTVEGALDSYAKGFLLNNKFYIAVASPLSMQEAILDNKEAIGIETGNTAYNVYNLEKLSDDCYRGYLAFGGAVMIPVRINNEDGWVVTEDGERIYFPDTSLHDLRYSEIDRPGLQRFEASGKSGTVSIKISTVYEFIDRNNGESVFLSAHAYDYGITPDAEAYYQTYEELKYTFGGSDKDREELYHVSMDVAPINGVNDEISFSTESDLELTNTSWVSSNGHSSAGMEITPRWNGILTGCAIRGSTLKQVSDVIPEGFAVRIKWNGETVEEFVIWRDDANE